MNKILKKSLIMTLAAVLLLGAFTFTADAAMKRTVKTFSGTVTYKNLLKKATNVKKGTTIVVCKDGKGYMKFTAPATKTYSFTISNVTMNRDVIGHLMFYKRSSTTSNKVNGLKVKTKGGKSSSLNLMSRSEKEDTNAKVLDRYLHKRTGTIKLKKGKTIFINFHTAHMRGGKFKLVIK